MTHEYWCDFFFTIEAKDNSKRAATQINKIVTLIAESHSDINESVRVFHKKRDRTDVLANRKHQRKCMPKYHGAQRYFVLCKKAVIPDKNILCIALKSILASVPTKSPSRLDWGEH